MTLLDAPNLTRPATAAISDALWVLRGLVGGALYRGFWFVAGGRWTGRGTGGRTCAAGSTINISSRTWSKTTCRRPMASGPTTRWQQHPKKQAVSVLSLPAGLESQQLGERIWRDPSHKIVAARISGNVLLVGIRINGLKSKALFLNYDPRTSTLGFSPVELYLGRSGGL